MSKKVFILGAGFSQLAGLPLGNELLDFIFQHLKNSRNIQVTGKFGYYPEISGFITKVKENYPWMANNVELLFTDIDLAILGNIPGLFSQLGYSLQKLRLLRMKLSGALVQAFDYAHFEFCSTNREITQEQKESDQIYWRFCENLNQGDTVITFNYDLIIEKGLWLQKNKWTFLDGYGLTKNVDDFQDQFHKYPTNKPLKSLVTVYKLHGSLGWAYDDLRDQIIFVEMPHYFCGYTGLFCEGDLITANASWDKGTTFIEPSYIKQFDRPFILEIWHKALQAIQQSNELIIIGYSLPEADSAARIFLSTGVRNSQLSSITVVDRSSMVINKFEKLFGRNIVRKKMTFRKWVETEN